MEFTVRDLSCGFAYQCAEGDALVGVRAQRWLCPCHLLTTHRGPITAADDLSSSHPQFRQYHLRQVPS